ncbi:MAG: NAD(P)/FAD-dependent oxidoreductase [Acidobacteriota bacterium]|nr:NAD(P)/FAD-dependent oxidoreductase [Acidobacteriota bacterium]
MKTRILILGGGFGGLYAALELDRAIAKNPGLEVTLVNRENFILFTPMLHEVAASDLDLTHIVNPIRKLLKRVNFVHAEVCSIDLDARTVRITHAPGDHAHDLPYDHLVLALGCTTNFFGLPGLEESAFTMKSLGDAIRVRNHLIESLEAADFECAAGHRDELLSVVVAGGGFSGVETIAGINDFLRESTRWYSHLTEKQIRVVLVHPGDVILPELGEQLGRYAQKKLAERGVEIRVRTRVKTVREDSVELSDGACLPTRTLIWTAGTSPHPLVGALPCQIERGRVNVNEFLEVTGAPGVWALGDCANVPDPDTGKLYPPTAQHAIREGRVLARNIVASISGGPKKPFRFKTLGLLAAIGRRTGVANILGFQFSGFIAWFLWRGIYLSKLPRIEKKVRVALDWTLDLFFSKDLVQFHTHRSEFLKTREDSLSSAGGK